MKNEKENFESKVTVTSQVGDTMLEMGTNVNLVAETITINAFKKAEGLKYYEVLHLLETQGGKIYRNGWNGKGLAVYYQQGYPNGIAINKNTAEATGLPEGTICKFNPYLIIKTGDTFTPWVPSASDNLSSDWVWEAL
jgi:hypothetical protein